jgi:drug/metabolite transporter (DMT)-like permease
MFEAWFLLGLVLALAYALAALTTRYAMKRKESSAIAFSTVTMSISFGVVLLFFVASRVNFVISQDLIVLGFISAALTSTASLLWTHVSKTRDASFVSPFLQTDSLFTLALSILVLSEPLQPANIVGILSVFIGGFIISSSRGAPRLSSALLMLLMSAFLTSVSYLIVKVGVGPVALVPISLSLVASGFRVPIFSSAMLLFRRKELAGLLGDLRRDRQLLVVTLARGLFMALIVIVLFLALSLGAMAKVVATANTAPLFAVVLGCLFLKERETARRLIGAAIIVCGVFLVNL